MYGVSAWAEVCLVQHGFVSGLTGNEEGDWMFPGPGTLRCGSVDKLCCPVPSPWGTAWSRLCFLSSHGHMQQSPLGLAPGPSVPSAHTTRSSL